MSNENVSKADAGVSFEGLTDAQAASFGRGRKAKSPVAVAPVTGARTLSDFIKLKHNTGGRYVLLQGFSAYCRKIGLGAESRKSIDAWERMLSLFTAHDGTSAHPLPGDLS